jgi:hypothetical protein
MPRQLILRNPPPPRRGRAGWGPRAAPLATAAAPLAAALALLLATTATARAETEPSAAAAEPIAGEQELGVRLGMTIGGRVTPGGLTIAGNYMYQLTDVDWFEGLLSFTFGGDRAVCFRDRADDLSCDHHALHGVAAEGGVAARRFLSTRDAFAPYVRVGLGLRVARYRDDDLTGVALPVLVGGGVRARVAPTVSVIGDAAVQVGPAWLSRGLGLEPQASLSIFGGVEFRLD